MVDNFSVIGKYIICFGISIILNPGGTARKNSWIVWTLFWLIYAPVVILHSTRTAFTLRMVSGISDTWFILGSRRRFVNPNNWPIESFFWKFISRLQVIILRNVLLLGLILIIIPFRSRVFVTFFQYRLFHYYQ